MRIYYIIPVLIIFTNCTKLVQIEPPVSTITSSQVFGDSSDAESAVSGIYSKLMYGGLGGTANGFGNGIFTEICGLSADELLSFQAGIDPAIFDITANTVITANSFTDNIWPNGYSILYQANAVIDGILNSKGLSQSLRSQLIGEAEWFRAFCNFYLTNTYGNIPLITSIDYKTNKSAFRSDQSKVYLSIINDLKDAQHRLPSDYSVSNGERVRVNAWAARALLARVYLYQQNWDSAEVAASSVINNTSLFGLVGLDNCFLLNNSEAILQWKLNTVSFTGIYNGVPEGLAFIPFSNNMPPAYYLSDSLLNNFEPGDMRRIAWIDSTIYNTGTPDSIYFYPYKYKIGPTQAMPNVAATEYYTVLRLAEQFLIRSEARAHQGKLADAIADLNMIRNRAGLPPLSGTLNQDQVLAAVAQERRIELFAEWGHRWFDLKRTNQATPVLSAVSYKNAWKPYQQLYPIPLSELQADPNLTQNPGY